MGAYSNFIQDFPERCRRLLSKHYVASKAAGIEVTLTIAVATSGLIVPFERLRVDDPKLQFEEAEKLAQARKQTNALRGRSFLNSRLWPSPEANSWLEIRGYTITKDDPNQWPELYEERPIPATKTVDSVLAHVRNALAHGSILTKGDPVQQLVFLSSDGCRKDSKWIPSGKFNVIAVSVHDFHKFLLNWFDFLQELQLPLIQDQHDVQEALF
jgi:hypothetical protein